MSEFQQFRVAEVAETEAEVDTDDPKASLVRLYLRSRTDEQIAVELLHEDAQRVFEMLKAYLGRFPHGTHQN